MTFCGNFALVGYSSGHIDRFNVQSGQHREEYGPRGLAHHGQVCPRYCWCNVDANNAYSIYIYIYAQKFRQTKQTDLFLCSGENCFLFCCIASLTSYGGMFLS